MYTDKCSKLIELCQAEIDTTAKYAEYGNHYNVVIREHRDHLMRGIPSLQSRPVWETDEHWFPLMIDSMAYSLARLQLARLSYTTDQVYYIKDIPALGAQIVESL